MKKIFIDLETDSYDIYIANGLLEKTGELLSRLFTKSKIAIVTDTNVYPLYGHKLKKSLENNGFDPYFIIIKAGEQSKNLQTLEIIYNQLLSQNFLRDHPLIALGGGVVGDIAGFAAGTYARGMPFIQIPTTLLAQVDSSVGGKVAINLSGGKNMAGSFYQPKIVITDINTLNTLPEKEFSSGMSEIIKYGLLSGETLFNKLISIKNSHDFMQSADEIICECCEIKRKLVVEDRFDRGNRMILNLGHTFGHAIEKLGDFNRYTHGEAVAAGMLTAVQLSEKLNICETNISSVLEKLLKTWQLPTKTEYNNDEIIDLMKNDKKNTDENITLILLKNLGQPIIQKINIGELKKSLKTKLINRFPGGIINIPASKSITHRAIICAAMSDSKSVIEPASMSEDIEATIECARALGARICVKNDKIYVNGGLQKDQNLTLNCNESGTTLRFFIPITAALNNNTKFIGKGRLLQRPLKPYQDIFGDSMQINDENIHINSGLKSKKFELPGNISSQFISGLLLSLPLLENGGEIFIKGSLESASYVNLTIDTMQKFGIKIQRKGNEYFAVEKGQTYQSTDFIVESDFSQAAFFLVASALGQPIECLGLNLNSLQGDRKILDILTDCGAEITQGSNGGILVKAEQLKATSVDVSDIPDLVPPIAVLFAFCEGESRITNAARLRLKESDRLSAITQELSNLGVDIKCVGDELIINGKTRIQGGSAKSWNDHRIAMAVAVAAIRAENEVILEDFETVNKSYPRFWDDFEGNNL